MSGAVLRVRRPHAPFTFKLRGPVTCQGTPAPAPSSTSPTATAPSRSHMAGAIPQGRHVDLQGEHRTTCPLFPCTSSSQLCAGRRSQRLGSPSPSLCPLPSALCAGRLPTADCRRQARKACRLVPMQPAACSLAQNPCPACPARPARCRLLQERDAPRINVHSSLLAPLTHPKG